jgi:hypothetical protein
MELFSLKSLSRRGNFNHNSYLTLANDKKTLYAAVEGGHLNLIEELVSRGMDTNVEDHKAFVLCGKFGKLDIMVYLRRSHFIRMHHLELACFQAAYNGHLQILEYLQPDLNWFPTLWEECLERGIKGRRENTLEYLSRLKKITMTSLNPFCFHLNLEIIDWLYANKIVYLKNVGALEIYIVKKMSLRTAKNHLIDNCLNIQVALEVVLLSGRLDILKLAFFHPTNVSYIALSLQQKKLIFVLIIKKKLIEFVDDEGIDLTFFSEHTLNSGVEFAAELGDLPTLKVLERLRREEYPNPTVLFDPRKAIMSAGKLFHREVVDYLFDSVDLKVHSVNSLIIKAIVSHRTMDAKKYLVLPHDRMTIVCVAIASGCVPILKYMFSKLGSKLILGSRTTLACSILIRNCNLSAVVYLKSIGYPLFELGNHCIRLASEGVTNRVTYWVFGVNCCTTFEDSFRTPTSDYYIQKAVQKPIVRFLVDEFNLPESLAKLCSEYVCIGRKISFY